MSIITETKSFKELKDEFFDVTGGLRLRNEWPHVANFLLDKQGDTIRVFAEGKLVREAPASYSVNGVTFSSEEEARKFSVKNGVHYRLGSEFW